MKTNSNQQTTCTNCGGLFSSSEPKCPYCGMIFEPGAELEYNGKLENIRKNLDNVDELAIYSFKNDLIRFLIAFAISLGAILLIVGIPWAINKSLDKSKNRSARRQIEQKINEVTEFNAIATQLDSLYDQGKYDEMYDLAVESRAAYSSEFTYWKHWYFYTYYQDYSMAKEALSNYVTNTYSKSYYYASGLNQTVSLYNIIYVSEYSELSAEERSILAERYEELKEELILVLGLPEKEYEGFKESMLNKNKTHISYDECEKFAKEKLGEQK